MSCHMWGERDFDWDGINYAARYIGTNLRKWGRVGVRDWKEKYGGVRVYNSFGFHIVHDLIWPGYCFNQYKYKWMWKLDCDYGRYLMWPLNKLFVPLQKMLYRKLYSDMVKKYPHLRSEILGPADWPELLKNIP